MYYPYLRSKQFELIALKEFAQEHPSNGCIIPIIEPVKENLHSLTAAIEKMSSNNMNFSLILNPTDGDFQYKKKDILSEIEELQTTNYIPAFLYSYNQGAILDYINKYDLDNIMIIFRDGMDFSNDKGLKDFLASPRITTIVNGQADVRATYRNLQYLHKNVIRLDDRFSTKKRNIDYAITEEEIFTEEPFYFQQDGFVGFSDYTTLPKNFVEGGSLPYAIAIHLTYRGDNNIIYIHHFVSDTNFDQTNIRGKFAEASRKVIDFFDNHPLDFRSSALEELKRDVADAKYPGLGIVKKISIKHHLELMLNVLKQQHED